MFDRETITLEINGKEIIIQELSTKEFNEIISIKDEIEQGYKLLHKSIQSPKLTLEEIKDIPNKVANTLLDKVLTLNGVPTGN